MPATVQARAASLSPTMSVLDVAARRMIAIDALKSLGRKRRATLTSVEHVDLAVLRARTTDRTILAVVVEGLNNAGVTTANTVGAVMDQLRIGQDEVHMAVCECKFGAEISGVAAARNFAQFN